ncbi:hypothetical protein GRX01_01625 [Halobaculum sp. WSA2]|uniref:Winged helix DNA-binding domain-containing protein n=1 Tax=Halobaculum saliterrae TaxID=2073113 RepID=A0A6B0SVT9_9EURY|nr:hypothetical protein [Halobaculum saliterrae]MXR40060.1 hypothetical protein [Halobaculum saliterrae]
MASGSDGRIRREILAKVYRIHSQSIRYRAGFEEICDSLNFDVEDVVYHLSRMDDDRLVETKGGLGNPINSVEITAAGIERLDEKGYDTILKDDLRYVILGKLYIHDRENITSSSYGVGRSDILDELDVDEQEFKVNIYYLNQKDLIENKAGDYLEITAQGRNMFEEYRDDGIPIPRSKELTQWAQYSVEKGDEETAFNLFRDIVELAGEEVLVVDPFAQGKLYTEMLCDVPDVVDIKVLCTDQEIDEENREKFNQLSEDRTGGTELRYLDYRSGEWPFHDRLLFVDRSEGWVWGHTFAHSGTKHHTISEMRPVNVESDLEKFDSAWEDAEEVQ